MLSKRSTLLNSFFNHGRSCRGLRLAEHPQIDGFGSQLRYRSNTGPMCLDFCSSHSVKIVKSTVKSSQSMVWNLSLIHTINWCFIRNSVLKSIDLRPKCCFILHSNNDLCVLAWSDELLPDRMLLVISNGKTHLYKEIFPPKWNRLVTWTWWNE